MTPFGQALIKARPLIEHYRDDYICFALNRTGGRKFAKYIGELLNPHLSYYSWVYNNHPEIYTQMNATPDAFREGRLQWMDYMIEQERLK